MLKQIEKRFGVSAETAKRDLSELTKRGIIEYVRKPHPGYYRQK
ncbi:MAG: DeoR family transcriptional regulator [Planctomycetota bacterium]|nr:MAG: DeoR family transcriptional regulator [Planctomycetota bacterium]